MPTRSWWSASVVFWTSQTSFYFTRLRMDAVMHASDDLALYKNGDSEYSEWRKRFWTSETARNYSSAGSSSFSPLSFSFSSCMAICTRDPSVLALEPIHCLYWSYLRLGSQCFSCQWWNRSRSGARTILKKRRGQHSNTHTVKVLATTKMLCRLFTRVGRPRFST